MERDQALKFMHDLLRLMLQKNGSDLFITAGFPPAIKIDGRIVPQSNQLLQPQHTAELARAVMSDRQAAEFETHKECNFGISPTGIGRFRANAYIQQGKVGLVLRTIPQRIPGFDELGLPPVLRDIALAQRGLVIFVGGTGTGKTTSLASMVDFRNENTYGHIITVEDPIEFVHAHKNCIVSQREVGIDTESWEAALKNTLRQAPDVILMGEIRDRETMDYAIAFAETGHLCLATLHANSANQAIDRIINFFPEDRRQQLLMDLSLNLRAIVSQRLLPLKERKGRIPAVEILLNSPLIADLIFKGNIPEIKEIMKRSRELGMQTFDQALFGLYEDGQISYEDALRNADSVNDLLLQAGQGFLHRLAGDLQQCAEARGMRALAFLQTGRQQGQQMGDIGQPLAGLEVFAGGEVLEVQRDVVRQLAQADGEAGLGVLRHQVDHGLAAIAGLAMHVLEQEQRQRAAAVEQVGVALLHVHQVAFGQLVEQAAQREALLRADLAGRGDRLGQLGVTIAQMLVRVVQQQGYHFKDAHAFSPPRAGRS